MESEGEFVYFVNNRRTHGGQIITPQRALDNTRPEGCTAPPGVTKAEALHAIQRDLYIVAHDPYFETGIPDRALGWHMPTVQPQPGVRACVCGAGEVRAAGPGEAHPGPAGQEEGARAAAEGEEGVGAKPVRGG